MKDDLNFFENGRRPQIFLKIEDELKYFWKLKTTLIIFQNQRRPQFVLIFSSKYMITFFAMKMEDEPFC